MSKRVVNDQRVSDTKQAETKKDYEDDKNTVKMTS